MLLNKNCWQALQLLLCTYLIWCFFTWGRVLGKQQKSPPSKSQHFYIIISLEKLPSHFQPLSRRASRFPCGALTLTLAGSGAHGSIALPWLQRVLGLAHTLAAQALWAPGPSGLSLGPSAPQPTPAEQLWSKEGRSCFWGCLTGQAFGLVQPKETLPVVHCLSVRIQLLVIALFFRESLQYVQRLREFPLFFSALPPPPWPSDTHIVLF